MKRLLPLLARLVILTFTTQSLGCAWMFHGTSDEIHIQSLDPKAELYVNDQPVGIGYATTTVERDKTATIEARAPGCETRTEQTGSKFDGISLLGLLIDLGIISILVVDMGATGAAWKTYPLTYTVTPICPDAATPRVSGQPASGADLPATPQAEPAPAASTPSPEQTVPLAK
jgi:hypothetical protein